MKKYECPICGERFAEGPELERNDKGQIICPICGAVLREIAPGAKNGAAPASPEKSPEDLNYPPSLVKSGADFRHMEDIQRMAVGGQSIIEAMATRMPLPSWDDIIILGAQLNPFPLDEDFPVDTETVIAPRAAKPLILQNPLYVSHMSFGALSKEAKIALAKGAAMASAAMCSGEGGVLPEEMAAAHKYIFEYIPNLYSVTPEILKAADAIEIKIGQGTKPGMGGHLPGNKVTAEIAAVRGKEAGKDIISPSRFPGMESREDLRALVRDLRARSEGRPIGIKIAAGRIERDLQFCLFAEADFITLDGRGGATGASPKLIRDATTVPTIYALSRARKYLDAHCGKDVSLIITGGLRVSADFAKALAMGADAIAVATAALMALGCQQYRICGSGKCPLGIATQDENLRAVLRPDAAAKRVANFFNVSLEELKTFARITGHKRLKDINTDDIASLSREISASTGIAHV